MNGFEEERARLTAQLVDYALANGLGQLSLRPMARAVGTSDRMLLYYFRDKADLLDAVLTAGAAQLTAEFMAAIPGEGTIAPAELFALTGELAASHRMRPYMRLWSEMASAAARGEQPVTAIAERIVEGFAAWAEARLAVEDADLRRDLAALLLVQVDGGALLDPFAEGSITRAAQRAMAGLFAKADF